MPEDSLSKCNSNRWATEDSYANLYKNFDRRPRVEIGFFGLPGLKKSTIACHMKRFLHVPTICRVTWLTWRTLPHDSLPHWCSPKSSPLEVGLKWLIFKEFSVRN